MNCMGRPRLLAAAGADDDTVANADAGDKANAVDVKWMQGAIERRIFGVSYNQY